MSEKPVILAFNRFYLPGYRAGGPIRTLANMVDRLSDDFSFRIVTLDRDAGDQDSYPGVVRDRWVSVGRAQVMYLAPTTISFRRLAELVLATAPDAVYLNSFFDPTFTQRILLARRLGRLGKVPVILAPRGEFSEGALDLKRMKKMVFLRLSTLAGLYRDIIWQASSMHERSDILRNLSFVDTEDIRKAMDLAPVDCGKAVERTTRKEGGPLRVCFLSRISPKKNLDFALRSLAQVKEGVVFTVYGPKELPVYWAGCESLISVLPSNARVVYGGEIHPSDVERTLAQHDLFFFPTRGENYGHVIHEALGAGLPVLLSDQTPWGEVVERGVGWTLPLDSGTAYARVIDEVASWGDGHFSRTRTLATEFALERAINPEVLDANRALFLTAIGGNRS